jgi:hypothetical protein
VPKDTHLTLPSQRPFFFKLQKLLPSITYLAISGTSFKFPIVVDMTFIMKLISGGEFQNRLVEERQKANRGYVWKTSFVRLTTAKFSTEINLRADQMVSKFNGEMVWPGLEYYP